MSTTEWTRSQLTPAEMRTLCSGKGRRHFEALLAETPGMYFPLAEPEHQDTTFFEAISDVNVPCNNTQPTHVRGVKPAGRANDPGKASWFNFSASIMPGVKHPLLTGGSAGVGIVFNITRLAGIEANSNGWFTLGQSVAATRYRPRVHNANAGGGFAEVEISIPGNYVTRWRVPIAASVPEQWFMRSTPGGGPWTLHINGVEQSVVFHNNPPAAIPAAVDQVILGHSVAGFILADFAVWNSRPSDATVQRLAAVFLGSASHEFSPGDEAGAIGPGVYGSRAVPQLIAAAGSTTAYCFMQGDSTVLHAGDGWTQGIMKYADEGPGFAASPIAVQNRDTAGVNNPYFQMISNGITPFDGITETFPADGVDDAVRDGLRMEGGIVANDHGGQFLPAGSSAGNNNALGLVGRGGVSVDYTQRHSLVVDLGGAGTAELGARRGEPGWNAAAIESGGDSFSPGAGTIVEKTTVFGPEAGRADWNRIEYGLNTSTSGGWSGPLGLGAAVLLFTEQAAGMAITPVIARGGNTILQQIDEWQNSAHPQALGRIFKKYRDDSVRRGQEPRFWIPIFTGFNEVGDDATYAGDGFFWALEQTISLYRLIWQHNGWDADELRFVLMPSAYAYDYANPLSGAPYTAAGNAETRDDLIGFETQGKQLAALRNDLTVAVTREIVPASSWSDADRAVDGSELDCTHYSESGYERVAALVMAALEAAASESSDTPRGRNPAIRIRQMNGTLPRGGRR